MIKLGFEFDVLTKGDLEQVGELMLSIIRSHFDSGKAPDGTPFAPYSDSYKRQLAKAGESTNPDMTRTGGFKNSWKVKIEQKASGRSLSLIPEGDEAKGWFFANQKRPVAGLSKKEIEQIMDLVMELLRERLKKRIARSGRG